MVDISNISEGLEIKNNIFIKWDVKLDELKSIAIDNNIKFDIETKNNYSCIRIWCEFIDLGNLSIGYHYIDNILKQVSFSNNSRKEFDIVDFEFINNILINHLGSYSSRKKNKYSWKFEKIILNHYYENIDGIIIEYLNITIKK